MPPSAHSPPGQGLAVTAELLYVVNLLLAPGLAFLILVFLYLRHAGNAPPLASGHLCQAFAASIWAGIMIVLVVLALIGLGGHDSPWTWVVAIIYFTTVHATLVLLGTVGLAKAMSGKPFRYPLIGRSCKAP